MSSGLSAFDFLCSSALWTASRAGCQVMDQKPSDCTKSLQKIFPPTPFPAKSMGPFIKKDQTKDLCSVFIQYSNVNTTETYAMSGILL